MSCTWYRDEEWLRTQREEKARTLEDIADECGVRASTISNWCSEFGISSPEKDYQRESWLKQKHRHENLGPTEIAEESEYDVSPATVSIRLSEYSIVRRHKDEEWLRTEYVKKKRSTTDMADECDVCPQTVLNNLEEFGIERRDPDEAGELASPLEGVTGEDHPFYGNTGEDHHWFNVTGEEHPTYVDGSAQDNWRDSREWSIIRRMALTRDDFTCQLCGVEEDLHVHHITPVCRGGDKYDPDNLETLCEDCHWDVHAAIY